MAVLGFIDARMPRWVQQLPGTRWHSGQGSSGPKSSQEQNSRSRISCPGRHSPFKTAPVADSQRSYDPLFKTSARADSQKWRPSIRACPGRHNRRATRSLDQKKASKVNGEKSESFTQPGPFDQPGAAERAIDTGTDVSRTVTEISAALQAAVNRLSEAIASAREPGKPLSTISAITREAPLASLFVAFLLGVGVARRR
jgi:hypothetical protein